MTTLKHKFFDLYFQYIYYNPLHVSSNILLILRRSNCINTASGIVTVSKWPSGAPDVHLLTVTIPDAVLTLILLMWRIGWASNSIPIYIQQDATLHSLFISGNCSTCFGWYFHPSSGAHTAVSTASGICHTVTAICRYRGRVGTGLSVLWVACATHSTLKPVPTLPR